MPQPRSPHEKLYAMHVQPGLQVPVGDAAWLETRFKQTSRACEVPYTPAVRTENGDMHPRTVPGIMVGYDHETGSKGYLLFVPEQDRVARSSQVSRFSSDHQRSHDIRYF